MTLLLFETNKPGGTSVYKPKCKNSAASSALISTSNLQLRDLPSGQQHPGAVRAEQPCLPQSWARQQAMGWPWRWGPLLCASGSPEIRSIWAPKPQGKAPGAALMAPELRVGVVVGWRGRGWVLGPKYPCLGGQ